MHNYYFNSEYCNYFEKLKVQLHKEILKCMSFFFFTLVFIAELTIKFKFDKCHPIILVL